MRGSVYEQLERDRIEARQASLRAERQRRELTGMMCAHASIRLSLALVKLKRVIDRKYRPDQPRVPAGNPGAGQFTDGGGRGLATVSPARRVAEVIRICVTTGKSLFTNEFGVKTFSGRTTAREAEKSNW